MGPVHSNWIESIHVATLILNQDQQLKSNIHVKSVRGMFVQILSVTVMKVFSDKTRLLQFIRYVTLENKLLHEF